MWMFEKRNHKCFKLDKGWQSRKARCALRKGYFHFRLWTLDFGLEFLALTRFSRAILSFYTRVIGTVLLWFSIEFWGRINKTVLLQNYILAFFAGCGIVEIYLLYFVTFSFCTDNKDNYGITSFGVSVTTLEEVFLKVGEGESLSGVKEE